MNGTVLTTRSLLAAALLGVALSAQALVEVRFIEPDKFADIGENKSERDRTLSQLEAYMRGQADKRLPASQHLLIEVLDVNLAGEVEPRGRSMERIRIVKDISWPTMELHFVLSEGDKVLREGKVHLSDMNYLSGSVMHSSGEPLRYEKQLLEDWFKKEFSGGAGKR